MRAALRDLISPSDGMRCNAMYRGGVAHRKGAAGRRHQREGDGGAARGGAHAGAAGREPQGLRRPAEVHHRRPRGALREHIRGRVPRRVPRTRARRPAARPGARTRPAAAHTLIIELLSTLIIDRLSSVQSTHLIHFNSITQFCHSFDLADGCTPKEFVFFSLDSIRM